MATRATGTFSVKVISLPAEAGVGDPMIGRMSLQKTFQGDLEGSALGQMLATSGEVQGSAAYVAIDRVQGSLHGRAGSFSLQHRGVMDRGTAQLAITIVPDSGLGELTGISGTFDIRITDGQHFYDVDYDLPAAG